jgi:hypothetical protein
MVFTVPLLRSHPLPSNCCVILVTRHSLLLRGRLATVVNKLLPACTSHLVLRGRLATVVNKHHIAYSMHVTILLYKPRSLRLGIGGATGSIWVTSREICGEWSGGIETGSCLNSFGSFLLIMVPPLLHICLSPTPEICHSPYQRDNDHTLDLHLWGFISGPALGWLHIKEVSL